ncbi:uncharacterized protein LOC113758919 [Coffea eugenioides]|uniref:uncharacterized protein LOC113758919 n=1 Tax=Coffea eugenioides TaxID=49369 RepID=UPI000F609547|nr:uncharacterized protein LOC113758919 [Coffea eugenioides]
MEARRSISSMAANGQQFGERQDYAPRKVNEVSISSIEQQLDSLTSLVEKLVVRQVQQAKTCGICYASSHQTDTCPTLQDDPNEYVNAVGGFPSPPQRRYDPYSNTYNSGWKDHPNFSYASRPPGFHQQQLVSKSGTSLEEIVKSLATNAQQFQQETRASIQNLENQTIINPKQNVSAITLRNGKELPQPSQRIFEQAIEEAIEKEEVTPKPKDVPQQKFGDESSVVVTPPPPFSNRFAKSKEEQEQEVFDIFRKVEVNIPLLDAIKQISQYAKFLRELFTTKKKLKGCEKIYMGESVSAVLQQKLPSKHKDPGMFTVPCKIGNVKVEKALIDLEAAINIMPRSIYNSLNLGPLKETSAIMQLADRSNAYPDRVLEDILLQVDKLVFPADFYVLDMDDDFSVSPSILLGRPFLMTSKTKIDVYSGTLTMKFDDPGVEDSRVVSALSKKFGLEGKSGRNGPILQIGGNREGKSRLE